MWQENSVALKACTVVDDIYTNIYDIYTDKEGDLAIYRNQEVDLLHFSRQRERGFENQNFLQIS